MTDQVPRLTGDDVFERAYRFVLDAEGGWTDDPRDPGGPTNLGLTLRDLSDYCGVALDGRSRGALLQALRALSVDQARPIYRRLYWASAMCPDLPAPVAVIHFDCSVNQGVGGAARLLQQALGVKVDGKVGRETLSAARRQPAAEIITRYTAARRGRYRALAGFAVFGRGWLARVDRVEKLAMDVANRFPDGGTIATRPELQPGKESSMQNVNTSDQSTNKWWAQSVTVWGALVTAAATVLPIAGPIVGIKLAPEVVQQVGDQTISVVQAIGGLIGTVMTLFGRARAAAPLERRQITVTL